jgi:hypothetical protein
MVLTQRLLLVLLIAAHLGLEMGLIALLQSPQLEPEALMALIAGAATTIPFGQVILLGFWLSRYSASFFTRLVGVTFTGAVFWMSIVFAMQEVGYESYFLGVMIAAGIALAWAFFEVLRRWWPWLVVHLHGGFDPDERRQVSLQQIMVWMGLFGIVLGLHRALLSGSVNHELPTFVPWARLLFSLLFSLLILAVALLINMIVLFPCIALAMKALETRTGNDDLAYGMLVPIVYGFGVAMVEMGILLLVSRFVPDRGILLLTLIGMNAAQFTAVAGTIVLLRHVGFIRVRS